MKMKKKGAGKAKLTLTKKESESIAVNYLAYLMDQKCADMIEAGIAERTNHDATRVQMSLGMTQEQILNKDNLMNMVYRPAANQLLNRLLELELQASVDRYLNTLVMVERNKLHEELFHDQLLTVHGDKTLFHLSRARHGIYMLDGIETHIANMMAKNNATDRNQFCLDTYGATYDEMVDATHPKYILGMAAECSFAYENHGVHVNPKAVIATVLNLRKDKHVGKKPQELRNATIRQMAMIQMLTTFCRNSVPDRTVDEVCKNLFGGTLVEIFDPESHIYILDCGDDNPFLIEDFDELFDKTIKAHIRPDADPKLVESLMETDRQM